MSKRMTAALAFCAAGFLMVTGAQAAVTVLGTGAAQSCYQAAEFGFGFVTGIDDCNRALENEPLGVKDRAATHINRGILRMRADDYDGALEDYARGLELRPDLAEAFVNRGAALIFLKRYKEAIESLDKGIAMGTRKLHYAYYNRAMANEGLGDVKQAYYDYKKALDIEPGFGLAKKQLERFRVVKSEPNGES